MDILYCLSMMGIVVDARSNTCLFLFYMKMLNNLDMVQFLVLLFLIFLLVLSIRLSFYFFLYSFLMYFLIFLMWCLIVLIHFFVGLRGVNDLSGLRVISSFLAGDSD